MLFSFDPGKTLYSMADLLFYLSSAFFFDTVYFGTIVIVVYNIAFLEEISIFIRLEKLSRIRGLYLHHRDKMGDLYIG